MRYSNQLAETETELVSLSKENVKLKQLIRDLTEEVQCIFPQFVHTRYPKIADLLCRAREICQSLS